MWPWKMEESRQRYVCVCVLERNNGRCVIKKANVVVQALGNVTTETAHKDRIECYIH